MSISIVKGRGLFNHWFLPQDNLSASGSFLALEYAYVMSQYVLAKGIIALSVGKTWDTAKSEWKLERIYQDSNRTCLCGHYPISEICVLKNRKNGDETSVGNCCVEKFMGISSNKLFAAVKRVKKDSSKPFNADVIELAHDKNFINDWEYKFYLDTWRKREPSEKQLAARRIINAKILSKFETPSK